MGLRHTATHRLLQMAQPSLFSCIEPCECLSTGAIVVDADSLMDATAESKGGGFALGASLSFFKPTATVDGATRSYVREGVDINADTLEVHAGVTGDRVEYSANAIAFAADISFGVTVQDLEATATVRHSRGLPRRLDQHRWRRPSGRQDHAQQPQ